MSDLAICLNHAVSVQDNWLANLKALVDAHSDGNDKRPGYRFVATGAGLSEEYVYQLYNEVPKADGTPRFVGPRAAKAIARAFANGRPHDWFDAPIGVSYHGEAKTRQKGGELIAREPPTPPRGYEDRHWIDDSDFAKLQQLKNIEASPRLSKKMQELLAELEDAEALAESIYQRRIEQAERSGQGGHMGGMSGFGELSEEEPKPKGKK